MWQPSWVRLPPADYGAVQEAYSVTQEQILSALRYAAHVAEHVPPAVEQAT